MKKAILFPILTVILFFTSTVLFATDYTFNVPSGDWNVTTNWLPNGVPTTGDNVTIGSGKTVTLNIAGVNINNLTLNGTLQGANALTIVGNADLSSGSTFSLGGNVSIGGTLTWRTSTIGNASNVPMPTLSVTGLTTIQGSGGGGGGSTTRTLTKTKLILNGGCNWDNGDITMTDNSIWETYQTFAFTSTSDQKITGSNTELFDVKGTLNVQGGSLFQIDVAFNNSGTVNSTSGALVLRKNVTNSGTFVVNTTDGLQLENTTLSLSGTVINGSGSLLISGATINLTNNLALTLHITSGTLNGTGNTFTHVILGGGTFNIGGTVNISGNLAVSAGALASTGDVNVGGTLAWSGGTIGSSTVTTGSTITINGVTTINGAATKTLNKKKLILNGGGTYSTGDITLSNSANLEIPTTKTWTVNPIGQVSVTGSGVLTLNGTLNKNPLTSIDGFSIGCAFQNNGSLNINMGSIYLESTGTYSGNGSITIASTGRLSLLNSVGLNYPNPIFKNSGSVANGPIVFTGSVTQTLSGAGDMSYLTVNNPNHLIIENTHTIGVELVFINGKILLQNRELTLSSDIIGANNNRYIQLEGSGRVKRIVGATPGLFPIGKSNYTPVTISQASGTSTYRVGVRDNINGERALAGTTYVNKEWDIQCQATGLVTANITMQWNTPTDQLTSFSCASSTILRHTGSATSSIWTEITSAPTRSCVADIGYITKPVGFNNTQTHYFAVGMSNSIPTSYTFNKSSGNWSDAANWILNVNPVPTTPNTVVPNAATANVFIPYGSVVTLDVPNLVLNSAAVNGTLQGTNTLNTQNLSVGFYGTLSLEGKITVAGNFEWTAGLIGKTTGLSYDVVINGAATINGTGSSHTLTNRKLLLNGGGTSDNAYINFFTNATLEIPVNKTFTYTDGGGVAGNAGTFFDLKGTLMKQGSNTFTMDVPFNNSGSVIINSGQLALASTGTSSGTFTVNTTDGLNFASGCEYTFTGTSINGTGSLLFSGGNATMSSNLILPLRMTAGTLEGNFNTIITGNIALEGTSTTVFKPVGTVNLTGNLSIGITSPAFAPMGNTTVNGTFTWRSGTLGSNTGTPHDIVINGAAELNTSSNGGTLSNRKLILNGGATSTSASITINSNATLEIPVGQTFTYSGSGNFSGGAGNLFDMKGTLVKQGNTTWTVAVPLNNTGTIQIDAGTLTLSGIYSGNGSITTAATTTLGIGHASGLNYPNETFVNNGTVSNNALIFNGTTQQTLSGTGSIARLTLNNANGLSLSNTQTITTNLTLTNGKIPLSTNDLSLGTATITGGNSNSYIQTNGTGSLKRTVTTTNLVFPIGTSNYTPITISQASGTDTYAARVRNGIDPTHPLSGTAIVNKEWDISRTSSNTTAATIKAEWNSVDVGVGFSCASARLLHYNGTAWEALPTSGTTTDCVSAMKSVTKSGVTTFSPFAIGLAATVLPLERLDFKAINYKSTIDLLWQTASEKDVAHFDIEQSTDGKIFSKIGETKAKGGSNDYQVKHISPPLGAGGHAYFRLKIVDLNGDFTYSKVISLALGKELSVRAYPNPVSNELTIDAFSEGKFLDIDILDVLGRSMYQKRAQNTEGSKSLIVTTLKWNSGIYFLKVTDGKTVFQQKIIKE